MEAEIIVGRARADRSPAAVFFLGAGGGAGLFAGKRYLRRIIGRLATAPSARTRQR